MIAEPRRTTVAGSPLNYVAAEPVRSPGSRRPAVTPPHILIRHIYPSPVPEAPRPTIRRDPRSSTHRDDGSPLQAGYGHEGFCGGFAPHKPLIRLSSLVSVGFTPRCLHRRARNCPVETQHAASPRFGRSSVPHAVTFVETSARVCRHRLGFRRAACRAGHGGLRKHADLKYRRSRDTGAQTR